MKSICRHLKRFACLGTFQIPTLSIAGLELPQVIDTEYISCASAKD